MFCPTLSADLPPGPDAIEVEPMLRIVLRGSACRVSLQRGLQRHAPVLDLLGHGQEGLLYVGRVLCRGLEEGDVELVGEFLEGGCGRGQFWREWEDARARERTLATACSTTFLLVRSLLLPTRSLLTPSTA